MEATEYQQLAMRTNDGKAKDRLIGSMLGCDMEWLFSQQVVIEQQIDIGGVFNSCLGLSAGILQCFVNLLVGALMILCR